MMIDPGEAQILEAIGGKLPRAPFGFLMIEQPLTNGFEQGAQSGNVRGWLIDGFSGHRWSSGAFILRRGRKMY